MRDRKEETRVLPDSKLIRESDLQLYNQFADYNKRGKIGSKVLLIHEMKDVSGKKINLCLEKGQKWRSTSVSQDDLIADYTFRKGNHHYKGLQQVSKRYTTATYNLPIVTISDAFIKIAEKTLVNIANLINFDEIQLPGSNKSRTRLYFDDGTILEVDLGYKAVKTRIESALFEMDAYRCGFDFLLPKYIRWFHLLDWINPVNPFLTEYIVELRSTTVSHTYSIPLLNLEIILQSVIEPVVKAGFLLLSDFPNIKFFKRFRSED